MSSGRAHEQWLENLHYRRRFLHHGKVLVVKLYAPAGRAAPSVRLSQDDMGITRNLRAQDQQADNQNGQFHLFASLRPKTALDNIHKF